MKKLTLFLVLLLLLIGPGCSGPAEPGSEKHIQDATNTIDDKSLIHADNNKSDWLSYGKNYYEDRYSELEQINKENVGKLGLAWNITLGTKRGIEATPLVVDGIMYLSGPWSKVYAINCRAGKMIWEYDPQVPPGYGEKACCDVVNRGVALYKGKVYVGTLDGRLVALDASNGKPVWTMQTVDTTKPYTITGAPRVVDGKVIIGNGGAEYGVRGYITAYDANTGKQAWRFFTVPGNPAQPFESDDMKMAAKTWDGNWWEYGGGGTAWDAMAYDPGLKLLYVGTGNGSPWNRQYRSPQGGDNLFLSSIVAINPDNGKMVWYYQTTPGDTWDYTATQPLILANLSIKGEQRKVIMQAPKNGFFYVLDRTNGKFISARPYTYMNWAKGMDTTTGKPIENDFSRYENINAEIFPGPTGGHNWQPMAYNRKTQLVYFPVRESSFFYGKNLEWKYNQASVFGSGVGWNTGVGNDASKPIRKDTSSRKMVSVEKLVAWDPIAQREVWNRPLVGVWNGGVVTTGTGLVFQGTADGKFTAIDADNGKLLWEYNIGSGIIGTPMTFEIDGKQYITIAAGWGGVLGLWDKFTEKIQPGTVYTFALDGHTDPPVFAKVEPKKLTDLSYTASTKELEHGAILYDQYCGSCHNSIADGEGSIPDLGYSTVSTHQSFREIVLNGAYLPAGMPSFSNRLSDKDVKDIQNFVLATAGKKIAEMKK